MSAPPPQGPPPTGSDPAAPPPPNGPPPPGAEDAYRPPAPRRLTRRLDGRLLGGVATGLAAYLGVDVVIVRIALVVLAFVPFPGFGVLLYVAMLLLVPTDDGDAAVGSSSLASRGAGFWVGLAMIGAATVALLGVTSGDRFGGGLLPLLLIGLGVALWVDADRRGDRDRATTATGLPVREPVSASAAPPPTAAAPASTTAPVAGTWGEPQGPRWDPSAGTATPSQPPVARWAPDGAPPVVPPPTAQPVWEEPPPRERHRSPLGRLTVGVALLAGGVAWLLDVLDLLEVPPASMLAVMLVVLGLGLLLGSVVGRARWLAVLVAFLLPVTVAAAMLGQLSIDLRGGVGARTAVLVQPADVDAPIRLGAGELVVDATGLTDPGSTAIDASVGAGELRLLLPDGAGVRGTARLEVGQLSLFDEQRTGISVDRTLDLPARPGEPTYEVDLRVGAGEIVVEHRPAAPAVEDGAGDGSVLDEANTSPGTDEATSAEDGAPDTEDREVAR